MRLLEPLAHDLQELRIAQGRPTDDALVLSRGGAAGTKTDCQIWREKRSAKARLRAGLTETPHPFDVRHSFASLLPAEGRVVHYVASHLGQSPTLTLTTYGHLFAE